jgi:hypothetical protein
LAKSVPSLSENGYEVTDAGVMLVAKKGEVEISIYPSAKLLIKCRSKEDAEGYANEIFRVLGVSGTL